MGWPRGVPGNGASFMGWGGPARGNTGDRPPQPRTAADAQRSSEISRDPVKMAEIERRKRSKEERAAALTEFFEDIALDVDKAKAALFDAPGLLALRLSAGKEALDRLEGKPPQSLRHSGADGGPILGIISLPPKTPSAT